MKSQFEIRHNEHLVLDVYESLERGREEERGLFVLVFVGW